MSETTVNAIDEYIGSAPEETREQLYAIRAIIREAAPEASEKISWNMPTFYLKKNLVHFAAHKNHIGFYPGPDAIVAFQEELAEYHTSKGAVQFPYSQKLPAKLIQKIVRFCVKANKGNTSQNKTETGAI